MLKSFRRWYVQSVPTPCLALLPTVLLLLVATASAQTSEGPIARQLDHMDLGIGASYLNTKDVSGTNYLGTAVTQKASSTFAALVQIRYTKSPLKGLEFNYNYGRFTENFNSVTTPAFGVQTKVDEYSIGYLIHLRTLAGFKPFASVGAGATAFKPTPGGGEALPERARMTYYYDLGADKDVTKNFGVRLQLRQTFYKAPDFGQNYLTIQQQTFTLEPTFGFYLKY